ncbi:MAG: SRPBCC family protein [Deltaproteobacteria bacterium]
MNNKSTLFRQTLVKGNHEEVWKFFSTPLNLSRITPPDMGFKIKTELLPEDIHEGLLIKYIVRPAYRIPTTWVTKIASVSEGEYFVDTQIKGPYKHWEHSHVFERTDGGVLMTDHVVYELPGGPIGKVADGWVSKRLDFIFDFREKAIQEIFN